MLTLTIRTDNPEAELGLFIDQEKKTYYQWTANYQLAETIHQKIKDLLDSTDNDWSKIEGVVIYSGPGSFTGLRIGISVANALAEGLSIPIVGSSGKAWIKSGISKLLKGTNDAIVLPEYNAPVHITLPKR